MTTSHRAVTTWAKRPRPVDEPLRLVLASGSPRRRELLAQLGLEFTIVTTDIDETPQPNEDPSRYVTRLAAAKAAAAKAAGANTDAAATGGEDTVVLGANTVVLGADTTVVLDGEIIGKPRDGDDAVRMLARLSGRTHLVHTGVSVVGDVHRTALVTTEVRFAPLTRREIEWYVGTVEPLDKAGAYAIQGVGASFVAAVNGSVSNVIGLPLAETIELLRMSGVRVCE